MNNQELITMLNRDLADEHAAIIRYLVHGYLEGEDTPIGASLLSRAREEMWHMHWLGMIIGQMGGEPDLKPAPYPFDPTSRASLLRSYVAYEKKLIPHYHGEAERASDPHLRRVLHREAWESEIHAVKFQRLLDKLSPEQAKGVPGAENELPAGLTDKLQHIIEAKYTQMLQAVRDSWVFQTSPMTGWQIMDFSMTKMKQLAHVAEEVADNGIEPRLRLGKIDKSVAIGVSLRRALEDVNKIRQMHIDLKNDRETEGHSGLRNNLDLSIQQEEYEAQEIEDWLRSEK